MKKVNAGDLNTDIKEGALLLVAVKRLMILQKEYSAQQILNELCEDYGDMKAATEMNHYIEQLKKPLA
tara:strand:+ start:1023 stop:1226 length:204 start_codon:yes stop_codon:yes gene_type:complete